MAAKKQNTDFINPFETGVSYLDFKNAIPKGKTIKEYCEGNLSEEETQWIENEIGFFNLNNQTEEVTEEVTEEN